MAIRVRNIANETDTFFRKATEIYGTIFYTYKVIGP